MLAGARRILPLTIIAGPFGLIYGVTAAENGIGSFETILASFVIQGGASQIALVELIGDDASWVVAVGTAIVINLRFALYSAAVATAFAAFPRRWRFPLAHSLADAAAITAIAEFETEHDPLHRRWFLLGAAVLFAVPWWAGTTIGVLAGGEIGSQWQLPFAVPVTFIALLVPSIRSRPMLAAAVVGGVVAVAAGGLPTGLNVMAGAFCGIVAGVIASPTPEPGV